MPQIAASADASDNCRSPFAVCTAAVIPVLTTAELASVDIPVQANPWACGVTQTDTEGPVITAADVAQREIGCILAGALGAVQVRLHFRAICSQGHLAFCILLYHALMMS